MEEGKWNRSPSMADRKQRDGKAGRGRNPSKAHHGDTRLPARLHLLIFPPSSVKSWRLSLSHMCLQGTFDIKVITCHMVQKNKGTFGIKVMLLATRNKVIGLDRWLSG